MTSPEQQDDMAWDALFDFLAKEALEMSDDEVQAELRSHRIKIKPITDRVKSALKAETAREELKCASSKREQILEKLCNLSVSKKISETRTNIQLFLQSFHPEQIPQAYFNRLKTAASEDDLQSLIEDIALLEWLNNENDDGIEKKT